MEPTKASTYRKERSKLVTVSSGAVFRIKKAPPRAVFKLFEGMGIKIRSGRKIAKQELTSQLDKLSTEKRASVAMTILLPACTVEPRIVLEGPAKDGELLIDEVEPFDAFDLLEMEMEYSGLTKEAQEKREKFRKERAGKRSG